MELDDFYTLFDELDHSKIDNILLEQNERKKVHSLMKTLKESAYLHRVAPLVTEIVSKANIQTGGAREKKVKNAHKHFDYRVTHVRDNLKFKERTTEYELKFKDLPNDFHQLQQTLYESINEIIKVCFHKADTMVNLTIMHEGMNASGGKPIGLPYMMKKELTAELVLAKFLIVSQSNKDLKIDDKLTIVASSVDIIEGAGNVPNRFNDFVIRKQSIIKIKNNDQLCALRCIAVGIAFLNKNKNSKLTYRRIRENQDRQCLELAHLISHDVDKPCYIKEIMSG